MNQTGFCGVSVGPNGSEEAQMATKEQSVITKEMLTERAREAAFGYDSGRRESGAGVAYLLDTDQMSKDDVSKIVLAAFGVSAAPSSPDVSTVRFHKVRALVAAAIGLDMPRMPEWVKVDVLAFRADYGIDGTLFRVTQVTATAATMRPCASGSDDGTFHERDGEPMEVSIFQLVAHGWKPFTEKPVIIPQSFAALRAMAEKAA